MLGGKNSDEAVRAGLREIYPRLWRFCLMLAGSRAAAEDLVHSTCVRAMERAGQFTPGTDLSSWVFRIARNVWYNELRAARVRRGAGLVPVEDAGLQSAERGPEANIFAAEVLEEVSQLPEALRVTVLLAYVEGYKYAEVAEILDIPVGTVMSRLAAARTKLAAKLKSDG